jgi:hypothetical protein
MVLNLLRVVKYDTCPYVGKRAKPNVVTSQIFSSYYKTCSIYFTAWDFFPNVLDGILPFRELSKETIEPNPRIWFLS